MHDTVIRGGTIVDGDGETPYTGDIAIDGGWISAVGGKAGLGNREIDADGLLVAPVWVDVKHPLRWTGYLGPDSGAFFLAWFDYSNVRELPLKRGSNTIGRVFPNFSTHWNASRERSISRRKYPTTHFASMSWALE